MVNDTAIPELTTIRRNRGISLEQIAESTKISVRSLEAIERGEFRKLPGGIYNTSYIRQYARAIDFDESTILRLYYRAVAEPEPPAPRAQKSFLSSIRPVAGILGW
jgi:cytoskeletal protein RodZ